MIRFAQILKLLEYLVTLERYYHNINLLDFINLFYYKTDGQSLKV